MRQRVGVLCVLSVCFSLTACREDDGGARGHPPIVGAWQVSIPEAPFPYHVFIFNADGTVQQANPDAGDANTSDSDAMGAWVLEGDGVKGKVVELAADRATHKFVSRGEISFLLKKVEKDSFRGTATALFFDAAGKQMRAPVHATMTGQRIVP
jgi:hypothetical protein